MAGPDVFTIARSELKQPLNCTTLITGGIAGIGLETALLLHDLSPQNRVVILDRAKVEQCEAPQSFLSSPRVLFIHCDITSWLAQRDAFETAIQRFGRLDNIFVNAGIYETGDQLFTDDLDHDGKLKKADKRTLTIDLDCALDTIKLAVHHMRRSSSKEKVGSIVLTASLAGYLGTGGAPLYSAAKHGLIGLLRSLKNDMAKLNIATSLVAPGITVTTLADGRGPNESLSDWSKRFRAAGIPINDPGEVADAVVWLFGQGMRANGKGLLIQAGKIVDVEAGVALNKKTWMGSEQLELFKGGRNAILSLNKL